VKTRIVIVLLLFMLPLTALAKEVSVVLDSYQEHEEWHEEFENRRWLSYKIFTYYSFTSGRVEASNIENYLLFNGLERDKAVQLLENSSRLENWWMRLQLQVPQGVRVGVENFRFRNATDDVWVKMVLEEMDSILGYLWVGDEPMGLEGGEYHLRLMARKGVDLKTALKEAQLVCDVTWHPGTVKARTETIQVQADGLTEKNHNWPVEVRGLTARRMLDEDARREIEDTAGFWDESDFDLEPLDLEKEDLWEITAEISKQSGYPLVGFVWKGSGVGGGWRHRMESPTIYDYYMDLWPEETRREVTFYVRLEEDANAGKLIRNLRQKEISLAYATEYVGELDYSYTPGPKYQVQVDMSKVALTE